MHRNNRPCFITVFENYFLFSKTRENTWRTCLVFVFFCFVLRDTKNMENIKFREYQNDVLCVLKYYSQKQF